MCKTHTHGATNALTGGHTRSNPHTETQICPRDSHTDSAVQLQHLQPALINTHSTDSSLLPWRPPYLLPKEAGSLVGSKLSQFNFCRATASRQRCCKRAQLPTRGHEIVSFTSMRPNLTHFNAICTLCCGKSRILHRSQIGLLHYMTLSCNYFLHFMLLCFMLFILGR